MNQTRARVLVISPSFFWNNAIIMCQILPKVHYFLVSNTFVRLARALGHAVVHVLRLRWWLGFLSTKSPLYRPLPKNFLCGSGYQGGPGGPQVLHHSELSCSRQYSSSTSTIATTTNDYQPPPQFQIRVADSMTIQRTRILRHWNLEICGVDSTPLTHLTQRPSSLFSDSSITS